MTDAMTKAEQDDDGATPATAPNPQGWVGRWVVPVLLGLVIVVGLVVIGIAAVSLHTSKEPAKTVTYVVPDGTAEDLWYGRKVTIMPPKVEMNVGDTLVIRNDDSQTASVGPFTVRAGETLRQTFRRPQTLIGECTLSGTGEVKIVVT